MSIVKPPANSMSEQLKLHIPLSFNGTLSSAVNRIPPLSALADWVGKVHQGDCVELLKKLPKESISVIVTKIGSASWRERV